MATRGMRIQTARFPVASIHADLIKEIKALGLQLREANADRIIKVEIRDYNFDACINGRFWYEIRLSVLDRSNAVLRENTFKDEIEVKGAC